MSYGSSDIPEQNDETDELLVDDSIPEAGLPNIVVQRRADDKLSQPEPTPTPTEAKPKPKPDETLDDTPNLPNRGRVFEVKVFNPVEHNAKTRRVLGFTSLGVLTGFYAAVLTCFVTRLISLEELTAIIAAFGGLQTLTAAVFGYYFAKDN